MKPDEFSKVAWLQPWTYLPPEGRESFESELQKEAGPKHPLYQVGATAVARRLDCDDVLFCLADHPHPLAVVHLTYARHPEPDPAWPSCTFFDSIEDWVENCMKPQINTD